MSDDYLRGADLDRVWFEQFGHHFKEVEQDDLLDIVSEHAKRLEQSGRCVAFARVHDDAPDNTVQLVCICAREADKEYLEVLFQQTGHEVYDTLREGYDE